MFVQIQIPDELYQVFAERSPERPQKAIADTLKRFAAIPPEGVAIQLTGAELRELSRLLGHPISTPGELVEHIIRSERVSLGEGIEVMLNPGQRQRLKAQADFFNPSGKATKEEYEAFVKQQVSAGIVTTVGV